MKDQLISFETAKLAKEKGFNEPVIYIYDQHANLFDHRMSLNDLSMNSDEEFIYAAPTQSLLQKWLRDVHNIIVAPDKDDEEKYFLHVTGLGMWGNYKTWEETLEIGLENALKLV